MFIFIGCMIAGILVGYMGRRVPFPWISLIITGLIWILLFLLGWEVGHKEEVINSLPVLGGDALLLTLAALLGSCLAAWGLGKAVEKRSARKMVSSCDAEAVSDVDVTSSNSFINLFSVHASASPVVQDGQPENTGGESALKGSLYIVGCFACGIWCGYCGWLSLERCCGDLSFYALCALMCSVGISIGHRPDALCRFRTLNPRLALLPLATIGGTLVGCGVMSLFLRYTAADCLAVGAGMGYYSLSSILITGSKGAELGTVALLSNIIREIVTLLCAPLLVRLFGRLAPISAGGATTADTTLPIILGCSGQSYAMLSVYHGFVVDFSVPFMVMLFCSL